MERSFGDTEFITMETAAIAAMFPESELIIEEELSVEQEDDPFAEFLFEEEPSASVGENREEESVVIDKTALFTNLQRQQELLSYAFSQVSQVAAQSSCPDPYCVPVTHTAVATGVEELAAVLPIRPQASESSQSSETPTGFTILEDRCSDTDCKEIYLQFEDGRTIKTTREALDALTAQPEQVPEQEDSKVVQLEVARLSRALQTAGMDVDQMAVLYQQGAYQSGHVESGCCSPGTPSGTTNLFSASSSILPMGGGIPATAESSDHEDHSSHEHCSCGGHFDDGKCEKCGAVKKKAA